MRVPAMTGFPNITFGLDTIHCFFILSSPRFDALRPFYRNFLENITRRIDLGITGRKKTLRAPPVSILIPELPREKPRPLQPGQKQAGGILHYFRLR